MFCIIFFPAVEAAILWCIEYELRNRDSAFELLLTSKNDSLSLSHHLISLSSSFFLFTVGSQYPTESYHTRDENEIKYIETCPYVRYDYCYFVTSYFPFF